MTAANKGFLLLTSHMGNPDRPVLTVGQFRELTKRVNATERTFADRDLTVGDLIKLGYSAENAQRILMLLSQEDILTHYLQRAGSADCMVLTRADTAYPTGLRKKLGIDSPGCLWLKGDVSLLNQKAVAVVGSRELRAENKLFAEEAGRQAAIQGYVLISGNARGADKTAQEACLEAGGCVIVVVADSLKKHKLRERALYVSEDSFDAPFTAYRALSRNRVIHAMGSAVFVAQSSLGTGGTWQGCTENLEKVWNPLFCYDDGSVAAEELCRQGAVPVALSRLADLSQLVNQPFSLFNA